MCCTDVARSSVYTSKINTIEVGTGNDKRTFHAHHELLTFYSGYFRAALNGAFAEAQSGVIKLESEEPAIFEEFVVWLYTKKTRMSQTKAETNGRNHYFPCVKLWIFADRRNVPLLMNEMIDQFQKSVVWCWHLPNSVIREVYQNTTEDAALRRMIVDMYKCIAGKGLTEREYEEFPKRFLFELVESLVSDKSRERINSKQYEKLDLCPHFHVHGEGVRCKRRGG